VQLELPFLRTPPEYPQLPQRIPGDLPAVDFVRMRRARRYVLRVRPDGSVRVTVPRGGSRREAARFLQKHAAWIERERARLPSHGRPAWTDGTALLLHGERVTIRVSCDSGRRTARYGDRSVRIPDGISDLWPCIEADLRRLAREELGARLAELAAAHQLRVARLTIRNQKSRWGSCSRAGAIALNFRLVQTPPTVRDYVLLHELMHLKQQNHSRRFWRLVEHACPAFRDAERWLKTEGRALFCV
jgi:predicted metal-dependent hydrolase